MFQTWRSEYWVPLETNREFASHFATPNAWVRLFRDIRMAFRRFVRREQPAGFRPASSASQRDAGRVAGGRSQRRELARGSAAAGPGPGG